MPKVSCPACHNEYEHTGDTSVAKCPDCGENHQVKTGENGRVAKIAHIESRTDDFSPQSSELGAANLRRERVVLCPECKMRLNVNLSKYGGRRVNCPKCKTRIIMPPKPSLDF